MRVKFRSDRTPRIAITAGAPGTEGLHTITVSDNGIGIDPRYAEKVFAIFARLHPRDQYEGTGIGLALCRKIVEFHGGTIKVIAPGTDGAPEGGTTLRFTLPVTAQPVITPLATPLATPLPNLLTTPTTAPNLSVGAGAIATEDA